MSVKLKFKCVRFERNIVLLWWFWIGFLFVFIKACSHNAIFIIGFFCTIMLKQKKWFMNEWIWKQPCTSQNKSLSAFSLSTHVQVLQTLARSFIKFILWSITSFQLNWKIKKTCSEFSVLVLVKDLLFSEDFYQRFDWQQPSYAKHVAEWCCKCMAWVFWGSSISDFFQKNRCQETLNISSVPNWNH